MKSAYDGRRSEPPYETGNDLQSSIAELERRAEAAEEKVRQLEIELKAALRLNSAQANVGEY